ncbi:MAG: nuclear transport factor 2 family protein [Candidatus Sulfotelmatobacter sp.]
MKARYFGVFLLASVCATAGAQDDSAMVTSRIIAMEKAWNQAFKLRDAKAIDGILADDIVLIYDDGSLLTKTDFLNLIHSAKASEEEQVTPESINVHVQGDVAIATGVFRSQGVKAGKAYTRQDRFVDTWMKKNGNWVCVSASATPVLH